jgi:hypothetical protein
MAAASLLDREMYSEAEAARYLRVPQSTLHYWLEGGERRSKVYAPVIRPEPTGRHAPVTWAEFIEAGLLRSYRRTGIPMAELRAFIELLRDRYQVPYPLADRRPFVSGRELVLRAQEESELDPDLARGAGAGPVAAPAGVDADVLGLAPVIAGVDVGVGERDTAVSRALAWIKRGGLAGQV